MELPVLVDAGEPFVIACYNLDNWHLSVMIFYLR